MTGKFGDTVKVRSLNDVAEEARQWRAVFCPEGHRYLDLLNVVKNVLPPLIRDFSFRITTQNELGGADGLTSFCPPTIQLAKDIVYSGGAEELTRRERFSLAHELGHLVLHSDSDHVSFARTTNLDHYRGGLSALGQARNPEWQANQFAAHLLMPDYMMKEVESIDQVMNDFGVSHSAAKRRFEDSQHLRPRKIPKNVQEMINKLNADIGRN